MSTQIPPTSDGTAMLKNLVHQTFSEVQKQITASHAARDLALTVLTDVLNTEHKAVSPGLQLLWLDRLTRFAQVQQASLVALQNGRGAASPSLLLGRNLDIGENFSIPKDELRSHGYLLGATGTGKSTAMVGISSQIIKHGDGLAFFDPSPHGNGIQELLRCIPDNRVKDVFSFEPASTNASGSFGINLLEKTAEPMSVAIERAMNIFDRLYGYRSDNPAYGERMKNLLRLCFFTLMHNDCTLAELPPLLKNAAFRKRLLANVPNRMQDHYVRSFWEEEYNTLVDFKQEEWASPVLNKGVQLLTDEFVLPVVSQQKTTIDFLNIMQEKKILLVHLPKNKLGEGARFLGTIIISELVRAAFNRPASNMPLFGFVIDEFQEFASSEFLDLLPTIRKQNVFVLLANQVYTQLSLELQGVVNQVATQWTFRVTPADAAKRAPLHTQEPPPGEPRLVNKPIISPTPIDTILLGRPHTQQFVNEFFKPWRETVKTARSRINEGGIPESSTSVTNRRGVTKTYSRPGRSWSNRDEVEEENEWLDSSNGFVLQVETERNPRIPVPFDLFVWYAEKCERPFVNVPIARIEPWHVNSKPSAGLKEDEFYRNEDAVSNLDYLSWLLPVLGKVEVVSTPTSEQLATYDRLWQTDEKGLPATFQACEKAAQASLLEHIQRLIRNILTGILTSRANDMSEQHFDALKQRLISSGLDHLALTQDDLKALPVQVKYLERWDEEQDCTSLVSQKERTRFLPAVTSIEALYQLVQKRIPDVAMVYKMWLTIDKQDVQQTIEQVIQYAEQHLLQRLLEARTKELQKDIASQAAVLSSMKRKDSQRQQVQQAYEEAQRSFDTVEQWTRQKIAVWSGDLRNGYEEHFSWRAYSDTIKLSDGSDAHAWLQKLREEMTNALYSVVTWYRIGIGSDEDGTPHVFGLDHRNRKEVEELLTRSIATWRFRVSCAYTKEKHFDVTLDTYAALELLFDYQGSKSRYAEAITFPHPWQKPIKENIQAEVQRIVSEKQPSFEQEVRDFRHVMEILAAEPVMELSSIIEEKPGPQRSIADMVNDMAQELIHLPNYQAYVKRGVRGAESVKIQTLPLEPECSPAELEARKLLVEQNTLPYLTDRDVIEKELQQRRAAYIKGNKAQPQDTTPDTKGQKKEKAKAATQPKSSVAPATDAIPTTSHAVMVTSKSPTLDEYLTLLYYFSSGLTLHQLVRLVGLIGQSKEEQGKINKREQSKINKLIGSGVVETVPSDETKFLAASGRPPLVYRLKQAGYDKLQAEKALTPLNAAGYSKHAHSVNEVLIRLAQGLKETSYTLVDFCHEKHFRCQKLIQLGVKELEPDGWLCVRMNGKLHSLFIEVDRKTEGSSNLKDKIRRYIQAIEGKAHKGFTAEKITIAFVNPAGKESDTDRLIRILKEAVEEDGKPEYGKYFQVASVTLEDVSPLELLTGSIFKRPFETASYSLLPRETT